MQALTDLAVSAGRETLPASVPAQSAAVPPKVDIMVALMSALSSPDEYVLVERGGELYIEPLQ